MSRRTPLAIENEISRNRQRDAAPAPPVTSKPELKKRTELRTDLPGTKARSYRQDRPPQTCHVLVGRYYEIRPHSEQAKLPREGVFGRSFHVGGERILVRLERVVIAPDTNVPVAGFRRFVPLSELPPDVQAKYSVSRPFPDRELLATTDEAEIFLTRFKVIRNIAILPQKVFDKFVVRTDDIYTCRLICTFPHGLAYGSEGVKVARPLIRDMKQFLELSYDGDERAHLDGVTKAYFTNALLRTMRRRRLTTTMYRTRTHMHGPNFTRMVLADAARKAEAQSSGVAPAAKPPAVNTHRGFKLSMRNDQEAARMFGRQGVVRVMVRRLRKGADKKMHVEEKEEEITVGSLIFPRTLVGDVFDAILLEKEDLPCTLETDETNEGLVFKGPQYMCDRDGDEVGEHRGSNKPAPVAAPASAAPPPLLAPALPLPAPPSADPAPAPAPPAPAPEPVPPGVIDVEQLPEVLQPPRPEPEFPPPPAIDVEQLPEAPQAPRPEPSVARWKAVCKDKPKRARTG